MTGEGRYRQTRNLALGNRQGAGLGPRLVSVPLCSGCPHHRHHPHPVGGHQPAGCGPNALKPTCHYSLGVQRQSSDRWLFDEARAPAGCQAGQRNSWPHVPRNPCGDDHCLLGWPGPLLNSPPHPGSPDPLQTAGTSAPRLGSYASGWGPGPGCSGWSACWSSCLLRSRDCAGSFGHLAVISSHDGQFQAQRTHCYWCGESQSPVLPPHLCWSSWAVTSV